MMLIKADIKLILPIIHPILSNANENNNDQPKDKLWSVVEEGSEVLGHDRLLQRLLIVGDQEGSSEEEWDNRIEEEQSKWVDKQFPPDKSVKKSCFKTISHTLKEKSPQEKENEEESIS